MAYLRSWLYAFICHCALALPNTHTHLPPFLAGPGGGGPNQPPVAAALQGQPGLGNPQQQNLPPLQGPGNIPPNLPPQQQGPGNPQVLPPQYKDQGPSNPQIILPPQQQGQGPPVVLSPQPQNTDNQQIRDQQFVDDQNRQQQQRRHQQPPQGGAQVAGAQPYVSQPNPQRFPSGVPNIIINPAQPASPAITGALAVNSQRRVQNTNVQCLKTHMLVTFRFSAPFNGYIYPHNQFSKCLLYRGDNALEAILTLRHGTCGDQENRITYRGKSFLDPVIEHRLMVQWEREIVSEDDSSVIVRCDRPDDYNKTVEWKLGTQEIAATLERAQHPGENSSSLQLSEMEFDFGNWTYAINESKDEMGNLSVALNETESEIGPMKVPVNDTEYEIGNLTTTVNENVANENLTVAVNETEYEIGPIEVKVNDTEYEIGNLTATVNENYSENLTVAVNKTESETRYTTVEIDKEHEIRNATIAVEDLTLKVSSLTVAINDTEYELTNFTGIVKDLRLKLDVLIVAFNDTGLFINNVTGIVNDLNSEIGNLSLAVNVAELEIGFISIAVNDTNSNTGNGTNLTNDIV